MIYALHDLNWTTAFVRDTFKSLLLHENLPLKKRNSLKNHEWGVTGVFYVVE